MIYFCAICDRFEGATRFCKKNPVSACALKVKKSAPNADLKYCASHRLWCRDHRENRQRVRGPWIRHAYDV
jgi:hypothetical protein